MKKIMESKKRDAAAFHRSLQKGYGIEHPERVSGYAGLCFNIGDVYASDRIADRMERSAEFRGFVLDCIRRFSADDYGDISEYDHDNNVEGKWIAFGDDLFARYPFGTTVSGKGTQIPKEVLKVRYISGRTYVLYDSDLDTMINEVKSETMP